MTRPVLVTLIDGSEAGWPLAGALARARTHYDVLVIDSEIGAPSVQSPLFGISSFVESFRALSFGLVSVRELGSYLKPHLFEWFVRNEGGREVVWVDAGCFVERVPLFEEALMASMELVPLLPSWLADFKGSIQTGLELGLASPAPDVIRLRATEELLPLIARWKDWIRDRLVAEPSIPLEESEMQFLASLPAQHAGVTWSHEMVFGLWSDLHPSAASPRVIGTRGLAAYLSSTGAALQLMDRRTSSSVASQQLARRYEQVQAFAPVPRYSSGEPVADLDRSILRAVDPLGHRWPNPYDLIGRSFRGWLAEADGRGLPRSAQAMYWARPDLQDAFPARTARVVDFNHWLQQSGVAPSRDDGPRHGVVRRGLRLAARRLNSVTGAAEPRLASSRSPVNIEPGVNVIGFLTAESGLGEAGRGTARAVDALPTPLALLDVSHMSVARRRPFDLEAEAIGTPFDTSIIQINPTELLDYRARTLSHRLGASWQIGFWAWETSELPMDWLPAIDVIDEIWTPSKFVADLFAGHTQKPVGVMGHPVEAPLGITGARTRFGIPSDDFCVGFISDAYSSLERKNPLGAVGAFSHAFGPEFTGVHLVVKMSNLDKFPEYRRRLAEAIEGKPVTIVTDYLDDDERWALFASFDAYLSLHRCEGFGLTILEAMTLGIPVVCTAYGGNTDFTLPSNAMLIEFELRPIENPISGIYAGNGLWAEPDIDQAAHSLRQLREDTALRQRLGEAGRTDAQLHSPHAFRSRVQERLRHIGALASSQKESQPITSNSPDRVEPPHGDDS